MTSQVLRENLGKFFRARSSVLVALSGGVDSSLLAAIAYEQLGSQAVAATGVSESLGEREKRGVEDLCSAIGIRHHWISTYELARPDYQSNTPNRCYACKDELYQRLGELQRHLGLEALVDGTHPQDLLGHRPGHKAAQLKAVLSPYIDVQAQAADIRSIAKEMNLATAHKPSSPCLSSRIAYGLPVTSQRLKQIERGEAFLQEIGLARVRLRLHESIARIEVPPDLFPTVIEHAQSIVAKLKECGFTYVTLDLEGYRSGSLLEVFAGDGAHDT
jgi:pyridinium-3,5-biscarboxylic acid mononucleotide sulfurtransferase